MHMDLFNKRQENIKESQQNIEYLSDITFIKDMKHTMVGAWHQYDVLLAARGYGWDMMKEWADYMATSDLGNISQVTISSIGSPEMDITKSYSHNGCRCVKTPELNIEKSMLSIAGLSKTLNAPMKIVWFNQTRALRFFTFVNDELLIKKYVETTIRRTFGTADTMKLGKPIPDSSAQANKADDVFEMYVKDVFFIQGRGVVLDGFVQKSIVKRGDKILVNGKPHTVLALIVKKTLVEQAKAGDYVGILIDSQDKNAFNKNDFVTAMPNTNSVNNSVISTTQNTDSDVCTGAVDHTEIPSEPVSFEAANIYIDSKAFFNWKIEHKEILQFETRDAIKLTEKEPTICLYEDGVKTRDYVLQTEKDEDFTGKYFLISVRLGIHGNPALPVAQIDGFISDTPEDREFSSSDIGYRIEGHFLACGGETGKQRYAMTRGQDLPMKALKYIGYTTPSNIRLMGICPDCGKSFCFHGYAFYMTQNDVAYSDDGLDCCSISAYEIDKDNWSYETEGKVFRYYNSFNCPHCNTPYIDYKKHPENKSFGVSGCVHLGRKPYHAE